MRLKLNLKVNTNIMDPTFETNRFMNCYDFILNTLLAWKGISFDLMFIDAWGFSLEESNKPLSERVDHQGDDIMFPIEKYLGIKRLEHHLEFDDAIDFIEKEIKNERPLVFNFDFFHCPWNSRYHKHYLPHVLIILGIDREKEEIYCFEKNCPLFEREFETIPFSDFRNGNGPESLLSFSLNNPKQTVHWPTIIVDSFRNKKGPSPFDAIRRFAEELKRLDNLDQESQGGDSAYDSLFIKNMIAVAGGRVKYGFALNYLSEEFDVDELFGFSKRITDIGWEWEQALFHLFQSMQEDNSPGLIQQGAALIEKLADKEEKLANELQEFANQEIESNRKSSEV